MLKVHLQGGQRTPYIRVFFYWTLYNGGNCSTIWQNKAHFYTISTMNRSEIFQPSDKIKLISILFQQWTCMIKARPKYPTDLYCNIYIDNIHKAVVICLIIPTIFPFHAGKKSRNVKTPLIDYSFRCVHWHRKSSA